MTIYALVFEDTALAATSPNHAFGVDPIVWRNIVTNALGWR